MKIYDKTGTLLYDLNVDDSSVRYRAIMTDDSLTLNFSLTESISIPRYAYVDYEGARYTLWRPSEFKKQNTRAHEYTLVMHGWREYLKFVKFKDMSEKPYRLKFSLTSKPITFLTALVACLNDKSGGGWSVGSCIDAPEKTLSFNHEYCIDVLNRLAQEFNTEFDFENKKINFGKVEKYKDNPLALSYGKGNGFLPGVGRYNDGDKQPVGRVYVQGGERNIDYSKYGSKTLLLPKSATLVYDGKTFRSDVDGMYITRDGNSNEAEDSYDASDIYPHRVGTVSEVIVVDVAKNFYDIKDSSIPEALNYRDCRIGGEKAIIKFESGALAGREFDLEQTANDLTGYIHSERRFRIVPAELDGVLMPGGAFGPKTGDKYAIFNVRLPDAYIADNATQSGASWDMFREAVRYMSENENDRFKFTGELDGIWSKSRWLEIGGKITPGSHVLFSDTQFQPAGVVIRIVAVKDYVNKPHKPEITLSNAPISGSFGGSLAKLEADEVKMEDNRKEVIRYSQRQWRDTKETMEMLQSSLLNFSGSINPLTVQTMQLIAGDESLQFRFVNSKITPVKVDIPFTFNKTNKTFSATSGILQHMTLGIKTLSTATAAKTYKFWDIPAYASPALTESGKAYYVYAKCAKNGTMGAFVLSETAITMEGVADYYHFLVGILNSENGGDRSFAPLFGYTEILPGRITTDKIVSQNGKTFFDLINGIIGGKIVFQSTGGDVDLATWAGHAESDINNAQSTADGKSTTFVVTPSNYKQGDFWILGADKTVNGIAYKAGEILTATQDSATFNEAHWIKKVRYTDDTAVENIKVGNVNFFHSGTELVSMSGLQNLSRTNKGFTALGNYNFENPYSTLRINQVITTGGDWTVKFKAKSNANVPLHVDFCDGTVKTFNLTTEWQYFEFTQNISNYSDGVFNFIDFAMSKYAWYYIDDLMVVQGNKAPISWIEAPEDVQARIDDAKKAGTDAQNSANTANQAVGNLNTYVDGAFKDGVIDGAEAKAIEKYINVVNAEKAGLEATYNKLYVNSYLEGTAKTNLLNAKVSYFGAVDNLLASINTAISDGKTTVAEKADVDSKYSSYKTALASLQSAIEEANKAIQAKIDQLSTDKVNNLQIGTRNFYHSKTVTENYDVAYFSKTERGFQGVGNLEGAYPNSTIRIRTIIAGGDWTVKFKAKANANVPLHVDFCDGTVKTFNLTTEFQWYEFTYNVSNFTEALYNFIDFAMPSYAWYYIDDLMVVQGNKAPAAWFESPEDVQARIDDAKKAGTDAQNSANTANQAVGNLNTYVDGAFKDGIIDSSEAKAIEKYINVVSSEKAGLEATYNKLYVNSYLEGTAKTNLLNAKVSYFGAVDNLLASINTAISDGKTSVAEKQDVDSKYATYKTALASLQSAIEDANKAIQTKIDQLSTDKVNNLQIGGRNYLLNSSFIKYTGNDYGNILIPTPNSFKITNSGVWNWYGVQESVQLDIRGKTLTYSVDIMVQWNTSFAPFTIYFGIDNSNYVSKAITSQMVGHMIIHRVSLTMTVPSDYGGKGDIWISFTGTGNNQDTTIFHYNQKLEIGNKATDYSEAPEDVQARIDEAKAKAKEADYLKAAMRQEGSANGGLWFTSSLLMKDVTKKVTAYVNGIISKGIAFASGVTNFARTEDPNTPEKQKTWIDFSGNAKFGNLRIGIAGDGSTWIEDINGVTRIEFSVKDVEPLASLIGANEIVSNLPLAARTYSSSETYTYPGSVSVTKDNSELTVNTKINIASKVSATGDNWVSGFIAINLKKDGVYYAQIASYRVDAASGYEDINGDIGRTNSISETLAFKATSIPVGTYTLEVNYQKEIIGSGVVNTSIDAGTMQSVFKVDNRAIKIGKDGISAFFSKLKYFHLHELGEYLLNIAGGLKVRGKCNIPGVPIEIAQIGYYGNISYQLTGMILSVNQLAEGQYRVNLKSGSFASAADFIPEATAHVGGQTPHYAQIVNWTNTYIDVWTADDASCNNGGFLLKIYDRR